MIQTPNHVSIRTALSVAAIVCVSVATVGVAAAQDNQPQPVLPDLAPREVEIRGELEVRFPLLERQPLVGFNPPPQIPVLPAGRRPMVEEYKQDRADLPQTTIDRPDAPTALAGAEGNVYGEIEAGAGSYFDRLVRGRFVAPVSGGLTIRGSVDYSGSDGSDVTRSPDVRNPFDTVEGDIAVGYDLDAATIGGSVSAFADYYSLYGVAPDLAAPVEGFPNGPDRSGRGANVSAWVESGAEAGTDYRVGVSWGASEFETELTQTSQPGERRFDFDGAVAVPAGYLNVLADVSGGTGGDASGFAGSARQYISGLVGVGLNDVAGLSGSIGVRALGTRYDTRQSTTGEPREILYLSPDGHVELRFGRSVSLFANNHPSVAANTLDAVFRRNPFVESEPDFGPTLNVVDAKAGFRLSYGRWNFVPFAGYRWSPNQLYFSSLVAGVSTPGDGIVTRHAKTETLLAGADLSFGLTGAVTATVGVEYRDAQLTALETPVPYYPALAGHGTVTIRLFKNRAMLRIRGAYEGNRYTDEVETLELDPIVSIDALATYDLTRNIGFTLRGINLADDPLESWNTYRRSGRQVIGGLRIRW